MYWWKVSHVLPYHGEIITEIRFVFAKDINEVIDIMSSNISPMRVLWDLESIKFEKVEESEVDIYKIFKYNTTKGDVLREKLVRLALAWQDEIGIAPSITSVVSEYDASLLVGCPYEDYCRTNSILTAVNKGYDFIYDSIRYQVKACRPSGKKGSKITQVPKVRNYEWDKLIWIMYDKYFNIEEAWIWDREEYMLEFNQKIRLSPLDLRQGKNLLDK